MTLPKFEDMSWTCLTCKKVYQELPGGEALSEQYQYKVGVKTDPNGCRHEFIEGIICQKCGTK